MKYIIKLKLLILILFLNSFAFAQLSAIIRDSIVDNARHGEVLNATLTILNPTDEEISARLYVADYQNSLLGKRYLDADTTKRSNAAWISFADGERILAPRSTIEVPVEIVVPADTTIEGSYWSMIMVEAQAKTIIEPDPTKEGPAAAGLEIVNRHALNVITDVGNGYAELSFSNPQLLTGELGQTLFSVDTENVGNRIATADVYLEIYSLEGQVLGRIDAGKVRVRPENPVNFVFDFGNVSNLIPETNSVGTESISLEPGTYNTLMIVDAGADELFGARYSIELDQ